MNFLLFAWFSSQLLHSKGGALDAVDGAGLTALHYAVEFDLVDSVEYLLANGAKANVAAANGATPLFAAILRRTSGIKVLECHVFICKRETAANALVR